MKLNSTTDYAIRMVLFLAKERKVTSSSKLAKAIDISPRYVLQIGSKLKDGGLIDTLYGFAGGYNLTKSPISINLYDIIVLMEGEIQFHHQKLWDEEKWDILVTLNEAYAQIENLIKMNLKSITIKDLLSQSEI